MQKLKGMAIFLLVYIIIGMMAAQPLFAFKPTAERGHAGMTRDGMQAVTYKTSDGAVLRFSDRAVLQVREGNASVDSFFGELSVPMAHFDNELLPEGCQRLINLKNTVISHLEKNPPDGAAARNDLGRALHTLQDFYAHSSWVNNPGPANTTFCSTLGRGTLARLPRTTPTCVDDFCDCTLTGRGLSDITSGYFDLFSAEPPAGKCAHGLLPGNGIHKDTPDRAFFGIAENCAIRGTTDYIGQIISDPKINGNDKAMRAFFDVKGSLGFVIDDTASMGEEISGVKTAVSRIIDRVKNDPDYQPDKYVLVTYGDPYIGTPTASSNAENLLSAVNAIYVSGGGDCPELAMGGLMKALDACSEGAKIYLFTDATAKDSSLAGNVIAKAVAKNIAINAALTGSCSPIDPAYKQVCSETGGQWMMLNKSETDIANYFNIIEPELTGDFQSVMIAEGTLGDTLSAYTLPVDATMGTLVIAVNMDTKGSITLIRPNGNPVAAADTDATMTELPNGLVINIKEPAVGAWQVSIEGSAGIDYSLSAKGNSNISFADFYFVEYQDYRPTEASLFPMNGQPIMGETQMAIANIFGPLASTNFALYTEEGTKLQDITLAAGNDETAAEDFFGEFNLPDKAFRIVATGTDESGNNYQRIFPTVFLGQSVEIAVSRSDAEMIAGEQFRATFEVTNLGPTDTFTITAADSFGYVESVTPDSVTLDNNATIEVEVLLNIPSDAPSELITLTVVAQSATEPDKQNSAILSRSVQGDSDGDGLSDTMEKGLTGTDATYDGNSDGTPDYQESTVGSFYARDSGAYVTLEITGNGRFEDLKSAANPIEAEAPEGITFPFGFFQFKITELADGASTDVKIHLNTQVDAYYKYGPTPDNPTDHWYRFDSGENAGALINGNIITLSLTDGATGDGDLTQNGVISAISGPGTGDVTDDDSNSEDEEDDGDDEISCFISVCRR